MIKIPDLSDVSNKLNSFLPKSQNNV